MDNTEQSTSEPPSKRLRIGQKRTSYLNWDDYFMAIASLSAMRSKDPETQVGACIVNDENIIVGVGYNGLPRGCHDDRFSWAHKDEVPSLLDSKHYYVCHAEMNAIMNKNSQDLKGCTIYTTRFPCNECAKLIIQSGIKNIVYAYSKGSKPEKAATAMFNAAEVGSRRYSPTEKIILKSDERVNHIHLTIETRP